MMNDKKKSRNYVNNAQFTIELVEYLKTYKEAIALGKPCPRPPDSIGEKLMLIVTKIASRHNFSAYSYKDEMIGDGIVAAVDGIKHFNPEISENPLAFFTQRIWWAFIKRIKTEKAQRQILEENMLETMCYDTQDQDHDMSLGIVDQTVLWFNS